MELIEPCPNNYHGMRPYGGHVPIDEFDPLCPTCSARQILSQHDHLHLGATSECTTPGVTNVPGQMVKCKCGSFHH